MFDKNKNQRLGEQYRQEKRMNIQSKVNIQALAAAAQHLDFEGATARNRSDLINACVEIAADVGKIMNGVHRPDTAGRAFRILENLGIDWKSKRDIQNKRRILEHEDQIMEGMEVQNDPYEEKNLEDIVKEELNKQKKARQGSDGNVAGAKPGQFKSEADLDD